MPPRSQKTATLDTRVRSVWQKEVRLLKTLWWFKEKPNYSKLFIWQGLPNCDYIFDRLLRNWINSFQFEWPVSFYAFTMQHWFFFQIITGCVTTWAIDDSFSRQSWTWKGKKREDWLVQKVESCAVVLQLVKIFSLVDIIWKTWPIWYECGMVHKRFMIWTII